MLTAKELRTTIETSISTYSNLYQAIELAVKTAQQNEVFSFELRVKTGEKDEALKYLIKNEYSIEALENIGTDGYFIKVSY